MCWKDFLTLPYIFQSWIIISVFVTTSAFHLGCIWRFLKNIFQAFLSLPVSFNNFLFFVFFLIILFHVFLDSPQVKLPLTWKVLNLSNQMFSSIPIFHTLNIFSCYYYFSLVLSASKQLLPLGQILHIHLTIVSLYPDDIFLFSCGIKLRKRAKQNTFFASKCISQLVIKSNKSLHLLNLLLILVKRQSTSSFIALAVSPR